AYAVIVSASVGNGRVRAIDSAEAESLPGVLSVLSHVNAPRLPYLPHKAGIDPAIGERLHTLQDDEVRHWGQAVALVIAETLEQAEHAAAVVSITYAAERPVQPLSDGPANAIAAEDMVEPKGGYPANYTRGDPEAALLRADVKIDHEYRIPRENHNPMEPHATVARWEGDRLTVWDKSQWVVNAREELAAIFGLAAENVHVICPFIGGAFGSCLRVWPHTTLAAMAARHLGRPVKLVLTRKQMYFGTGFRPDTWQRFRIGAAKDGKLVSVEHEARAETSRYEHFFEGTLNSTRFMYSCPDLTTRYRLVPQDVHTPNHMRGPGVSSGIFALESAMDELAHSLEMDPVELRLLNEPTIDEGRNVPFSSRSIRECLRAGAEQFGWHRRSAKPGTQRDGNWLTGLGMSAATYHTLRSPSSARVRLRADGSAVIETAASDMGPGTYTSLTQVACDALGLPPEKVHVVIGDSDFPRTPAHGGSQTMASVGSAVFAACRSARAKHEERSKSGSLNRDEIVVTESSQAGDEGKRFAMHAFGAVFAEVRVDVDLGLVRVVRVVGAYGTGRIVNPRMAHSQAIGGIVGGIGMA
ncbi:MAG TPA: xanthine dehydrogenase family protein molybdopterin-binding subunit, partial [Steroidobacteraceae bacterium]|nr:xanthine dehydrogenase family protein molybdopterin-binding subunit [Steroidobacteraceae bacterium]